MWEMWIVFGSGNANFVYFQSLISSGAQALICCETVGAARKIKATKHISDRFKPPNVKQSIDKSSNTDAAVK